MTKKIIIISVIALAFTIGPCCHAQMAKGQINVGPRVGLWWSGFGFGVSGEFIIMKIGDIGFLGAGGEVGFSTEGEEWNYGWGTYGYRYTYIPLLAFASFHYPIPSVPKLVPFARAGFGVIITSTKLTGDWGIIDPSEKGTYFDIIFQAGIRYQLASAIWIVLSTGWPYYLSVGVDFSFGGK